MTRTVVVHTAQLSRADRQAARELLEAAFPHDFTEEDWEHALGGLHALVREGHELIAHGAVVQRRLLHGGRALRAGYVEGVAVHPRQRGRGHGGAVMAQLERVIANAYEIGALGATDEAVPLYERRGWRRWLGPTSAITPEGVRRTASDDGGVYVLSVSVAVDLASELTCDWRDGDLW
jgi:aminoglycoside 2'-N-acetyltransferase I